MDYACSPIPQTLHKRKETASHQSNNGNANIHHSDSHASGISAEELKRIERSILLSIKINKLVRDNSCVKNLETGECASMILLSLPPPPENHPALNYMTYLDMIIEGITSPMLLVRGYRRQVLTLYTWPYTSVAWNKGMLSTLIFIPLYFCKITVLCEEDLTFYQESVFLTHTIIEHYTLFCNTTYLLVNLRFWCCFICTWFEDDWIYIIERNNFSFVTLNALME